jgi:hypothetical protein
MEINEKTLRSGLTADGNPVVFLDPEGTLAVTADEAEKLGIAFTDCARRSKMMSEVKKWLLSVGCPVDVANRAALDLEQKDNKGRLMDALMPLAGLFGR